MDKTGIRVIRSQHDYMKEDSPQAHLDFPPAKPPPPGRVLCAQCQGYGGWNSRLNAYPLPEGMEDTPENRHNYAHFRASCENCNGWGHVPEGQSDHVHRWGSVSWTGMLRRERCGECGQEQQVDTSG